jgi:EAL domain-containing protein (putative c-di-GMP-specific phosphodiesterase class I)
MGEKPTGQGQIREDRFATLKNFGCQFAQGYFFYRPIDQSAIEGLIQKQGTQAV